MEPESEMTRSCKKCKAPCKRDYCSKHRPHVRVRPRPSDADVLVQKDLSPAGTSNATVITGRVNRFLVSLPVAEKLRIAEAWLAGKI